MRGNESSPLFRKASQRAETFDDTEQPARSKRAGAGEFGWMALATIEGLLRDQLLLVTVASSVLVAIFALVAASLVWTPICLIAGIAGIVLVRLALKRSAGIGSQWLTSIIALAVNFSAFVALWKFGSIR